MNRTPFFLLPAGLCGLLVLGMAAAAPAQDDVSSQLGIASAEITGDRQFGLTLEFNALLAGSVWDVYSSDAEDHDTEAWNWRLAESGLTLDDTGRQTWIDAGQGGRLPVADVPLRFYLLRKRTVAGEAPPPVLVIRTVSEPLPGAAEYRVEVSTLDAEHAAALFATRFDADEGFVPGALHKQVGWTATGDVMVDPSAPHAGDHAVRLRGENSRMRRFVTVAGDGVRIEMSIYVSSTSGVQRAEAELPPRVSSSIAFHPRIGFYAFDGDGVGGGRWVVVPDSRHVDQWVRVVVENNYSTKQWSIVVQDGEPLTGLGFRNAELAGLEEINFYSGNNREMLVDSIVIEGR